MAEYKSYSKEDIINALSLIKNICKSNTLCDACPFSRNVTKKCVVTGDSPMNWDIKEIGEEEIWRAFK